jgi:hypothetical protein
VEPPATVDLEALQLDILRLLGENMHGLLAEDISDLLSERERYAAYRDLMPGRVKTMLGGFVADGRVLLKGRAYCLAVPVTVPQGN